MKTVLIGAALAAALLAAPAAANAGEKRRDLRVSVADLDLGTREGIAALDRRLARAAAKACGTAHYLNPEGLNDVDRCRADALKRASIWRNSLVEREGRGTSAAGALR